jgi:DNA polymerase
MPPTTPEALAQQIRACQRCPLGLKATQHVLWRGTVRPGVVLFIGEAPGPDEDIAGLPFVGQAGQLLQRWIDGPLQLGDNWLIFNSIQCLPRPANGKRSFRVPTRVEIDQCRPWLLALIEMVQPTCVVALGSVALRALALAKVPGVLAIKHPSWYRRYSGSIDGAMDFSRADVDRLRMQINARLLMRQQAGQA